MIGKVVGGKEEKKVQKVMTKYFERVANSEKSVVRTSLCENSEKSVF
jgi:hypothetical protein